MVGKCRFGGLTQIAAPKLLQFPVSLNATFDAYNAILAQLLQAFNFFMS